MFGFAGEKKKILTSLEESHIVSLHSDLERPSGGEKPRSGIVVAVSVNCRQVFVSV